MHTTSSSYRLTNSYVSTYYESSTSYTRRIYMCIYPTMRSKVNVYFLLGMSSLFVGLWWVRGTRKKKHEGYSPAFSLNRRYLSP